MYSKKNLQLIFLCFNFYLIDYLIILFISILKNLIIHTIYVQHLATTLKSNIRDFFFYPHLISIFIFIFIFL